ncbi:MAG: RNA polymerase, sigma-24 subunit, ECF subfamily [Candidatus Magasanikbacteria bacterium GW2011_GWC2_40_17]|uniref:RNA polymerase, sigma-24 subunit, ECF subfamily n=1 Tax=Candidatus Magasanikbacteria bacterium GW2011_GWA2_42_32 TaxID=1619039 RepID=A0A0G1CDI7_9BACT|nr:MAG: RNA polymerase, sigma-24 subunit, ECF subfamily [Candidatus Magasanikbacteria bacterium GW2011_GWC2_40_17]KKS56761.1 MAG: RNA polymerase, sigma-24 subunit, ECF subfamily [Candidatus Magasanikbacteria bacterium GW2011_GWA2_42_32]OGH86050.1 MAG: hypothetical protein A2294_02195 [Candidatus Magasanikbacteria bacterium RIFOXYB2_FULL_38_10]
MPFSQLTDEEVVVAVREKNKELYSEIVRRYQTKLAHYLRKFIIDPDQLQDVLQDVFIKAYRNLFGFNAERKFSPWIYRIAHNEALNYLKKHSREVLSLDPEEQDIVDKKIDIKEGTDKVLTKEKINKALSLLKEKYRTPLILYFFEQMSYEEISDVLETPKSSVGVLIMRAKSQLKKNLEEKFYGK